MAAPAAPMPAVFMKFLLWILRDLNVSVRSVLFISTSCQVEAAAKGCIEQRSRTSSFELFFDGLDGGKIR